MGTPLNPQLLNNIAIYNKSKKNEVYNISQNNSALTASNDNVNTTVNGWRGSGAFQISRNGSSVQFSTKYNFG